MAIQDKQKLIADIQFSFWKKKFDEKFTNPVENFSEYFNPINEMAEAGPIRDSMYISMMKGLLGTYPEFEHLKELEAILLETVDNAINDYERLMTQASEKLESIKSLIH